MSEKLIEEWNTKHNTSCICGYICAILEVVSVLLSRRRDILGLSTMINSKWSFARMIPQQFVITVALGSSLISLQYAEGLNYVMVNILELNQSSADDNETSVNDLCKDDMSSSEFLLTGNDKRVSNMPPDTANTTDGCATTIRLSSTNTGKWWRRLRCPPCSYR